MKTATAVCCIAAAMAAAALDGATAALADWTPPAWSYDAGEIATLPTVVLVVAGKTLPLRVLPNTQRFGRHARWSAEFGIVSARGDYTAPPYTPPWGEDALKYADPAEPKAGSLHFVVHILPNPKIPGSRFTPFSYERRPGDPYRPGVWPSEPVVLTPPAKMPQRAFLRTITVVERGEKPLPPDELTAIRRVPTITVAGVRVYRLPARDAAGAAVNAVYVPLAALDAPLHQARELSTFTGNPYTNPDPCMPHLGKGGSRKWQTWCAPCP